MKRINKLRKESEENCKDNNIVDMKNDTNSINNNSDNNISAKYESKNENSQLQRQIAEEKAAAKIFPLNLISNKFKPKDPNTLKGKLILYN